MRFLFVILSSGLIMFSSNDHENREEGRTNPSYCRLCNNTLQDLRFK